MSSLSDLMAAGVAECVFMSEINGYDVNRDKLKEGLDRGTVILKLKTVKNREVSLMGV